MMRFATLYLIVMVASAAPPPKVPLSGAPRINVLDAGAKCDGRSDDTMALRAARAQADTDQFTIIQLPPSVCLFSGQLIFGGSTSRYSEISVEGHSEYTSTLKYTGTQSP